MNFMLAVHPTDLAVHRENSSVHLWPCTLIYRWGVAVHRDQLAVHLKFSNVHWPCTQKIVAVHLAVHLNFHVHPHAGARARRGACAGGCRWGVIHSYARGRAHARAYVPAHGWLYPPSVTPQSQKDGSRAVFTPLLALSSGG